MSPNSIILGVKKTSEPSAIMNGRQPIVAATAFSCSDGFFVARRPRI